VIAHAGGFDEILIAAGAVALIYLLRRPRGAPGEAPRERPAGYSTVAPEEAEDLAEGEQIAFGKAGEPRDEFRRRPPR
jgi:hypothetical protein